jgi:hypothetical protein
MIRWNYNTYVYFVLGDTFTVIISIFNQYRCYYLYHEVTRYKVIYVSVIFLNLQHTYLKLFQFRFPDFFIMYIAPFLYAMQRRWTKPRVSAYYRQYLKCKDLVKYLNKIKGFYSKAPKPQSTHACLEAT